MLDLQKASAGSGKTYTLARQYLEYLLTTGRPPRLRSRAEIEDALRHILAITFTNKATAEMKGRIVAQLAALADDRKSDYIDYFTQSLGVEREKVKATAAQALAILLNSYSDFQVSTIDAFFQSILRTFAFEIGLNDSYGLELDDSYIAQSAIDSTLSDVNADNGTKKDAYRWIIEFMRQKLDAGDKSWNLFYKRDKKSTYNEILDSVKKMSSESFKDIRDNLHAFYAGRENTLADYRAINDYFHSRLAEPVAKAREHAVRLIELMPGIKSDIPNNKTYWPQKVLDMNIYDTRADKPFKFDEASKDSAFKTKVKISPEHEQYQKVYQAMIDELLRWRNFYSSAAFKLWKAYRNRYKMLPMMQIAAEKSAEMLREANMLNMSETNTILSKVIGDDDAPFIYERLGTRLEHYLIDEFQDTSKMQWGNLRPLIDESMSHGHGNLIIGDAKQSIYRFRNADPSLITTQVPAEYPGRVNFRGAGEDENSNYRSLRNIVEFNNSLFTALAARWDSEQAKSCAAETDFFRRLYDGVVQRPVNTPLEGYVDITYYDAAEDTITNIPPLIDSLRSRGYHLADIAVLVHANKTGKLVVEKLMEYNAGNPENAIEFVSEESLVVSNSATVKVIIAVLRLIAEGALSDLDLAECLLEEEEADRPDEKKGTSHRKRLSIALFYCRYQLVALSHPEFSVDEILNFMNLHKVDTAPLQALIDASGSLALPALIETIVMRFIDEENRRREAPFIAALQDMVLDFCDRYPSDVLSFLQWWDLKGSGKSISTPEGVDAVSIMTVHKAKGLENQCIILPELDRALTPRGNEWLWVETDKKTLGLPPHLEQMIPDYLPVEAAKELEDTSHKEEYFEYLRKVRMDYLNSLYVACTRAVAELYVLSSDSKDWATQMMGEALAGFAATPPEGKYALHTDLLTVDAEEGAKGMKFHRITYGQPLEKEKIGKLKSKLKDVSGEVITDYPVSDPSGVLRYRDPEEGYRYNDDPDPRSFGNKLHNIMQYVIRLSDIDRSVMRQVVAGSITDEEGAEARRLLHEKMATPIDADRPDSPTAAEWFRPGVRVINERTLLEPRRKKRRPDRIIVDAEGAATVIDYKFGDEELSDHTAQVRDYMSQLRASGAFSRVDGFLWYVMRDRIIRVD